MIKQILKTAFRFIRKDTYQSSLNILGLALGFSALLYISAYFFHEYSFDKFHEKSDRIYRIVTKAKITSTEEILPHSELPIAAASKKDIPEIEDATRIFYQKNVTVNVDEDKYIEKRFWYADENFLQIFDFALKEGDKTKVLAEPNHVVLTESLSKKYFGEENPIGKTIKLNNGNNLYVVSGILEDIPSNSHLQFDMLASFSSLPLSNRASIGDWGHFRDMYSYVLAKENIDSEALMKKFQAFPIKYYEKMLQSIGFFSLKKIEEQGGYVHHSLQPLAKIHLNDTFRDEVCVHGNKQLLHALGIIGILIIFIACFNFINLNTARASLRAKEIGIKKMMGSSRKKLIVQLLTETFLLCTIALLIAIAFLSASFTVINQITNLTIEIKSLFSSFNLLTMIVIPLFVVIVAGIFPSYVISKFNPAEVIKGSALNWNSNLGLRNSLVAFQFVVFIMLICGVVLVKKQIRLLHHQNPGFYKENVLVVKNTNKLGGNSAVFKDEVLKTPSVINASYTSELPSMFSGDNNPFSKTDKKEAVFLNKIFTDKDFFETLKIGFADGHSFKGSFAEERNNAIISKKTAELFGWNDCKDKIIFDYLNGRNYNVIGIVEDFHIESLKNSALPLIIRCTNNADYLAIRIHPGSATAVIDLAGNLWKELTNEDPFQYLFLNESFDNQYKAEVQFGTMINLFSFISIVIACLGLLGLVSFTLNRKQKEIGIRKVNGAKVSEVLAMLNKDFVKWVAIAFVIACPIAYYAMSKWLENFAYKTTLSWWIFVLAGVLALGIALLTVSWQSWKAATRNPVEALRYE